MVRLNDLARAHIAKLAIAAVITGAWWLGPRASMRTLAMVAAPFAVTVAVLKPGLALVGLVLAAALVPLKIATGTETTVNVVNIGVAGLTAVWVLRMVLARSVRLRPSPANLPWLAIAAFSGLSIIAGSALWNPIVVTKSNFILVQMAQWAVFVLAACAFWLAGNSIDDRRVIKWIVAIMLLLAAMEVMKQAVPPLQAIPVKVVLYGPIFRAWAAALAMAMALVWTTGSARLRTALAALAFSVVLAPFFAVRDWASGWMPALVAVAAVVLFWLWNERRALALATVSLGSLAGVGLLATAAAQLDRWSLDTRLIAWQGLAQLLEGRWLMGLGLASYWHYWRGVLGSMAYLDPETGYLHYTYDPTVNMHNNYVDVLGQMGIVGLVVLLWLIFALYVQVTRTYLAERDSFGRAFAVACFGGLTGMVFAGMLGDWFLPFVYNIGLEGFRDAFVGWLLLGGLVLLDATRGKEQPAADTGAAVPDFT